jgi:hypothetical protein
MTAASSARPGRDGSRRETTDGVAARLLRIAISFHNQTLVVESCPLHLGLRRATRSHPTASRVTQFPTILTYPLLLDACSHYQPGCRVRVGGAERT